MIRNRIPLLVATAALLVALVGGLAPSAQAAKKLEGSLTTPQVPAWLGLGGGETKAGSDTVTAMAFARACRDDRAAHAAGNPKGATNIATFLKSPQNGLDAYVFDLGKEMEGAFMAEGPGAITIVPDAAGTGIFVNTYDLDLDFFTDADVDAKGWSDLNGIGCPNANDVSSSHKCYSHSPQSHEKTGCINGYKDAKKVKHGARYVMVSGSLNLIGPMKVTLTTP